jgi:hypothetical protein
MLPVSSGACDKCHDLAAIAARFAGDAMPAFFRDADRGIEPSVRVVLGHFISFTSIPTWTARPYREVLHERDGRLKRLSLHRGAVRSERAYMAALEEARMRQNMAPFAQLRGQLVEEGAARQAGGKSAKR